MGSLVFRALATDPDDPNTLEGTVHYSFLEETKDSSGFSINPETGLITTKGILDRETQDQYTLVLVARDMGDVPQQSTKIFNVIVTDVDDNKPVFNRSVVNGSWNFERFIVFFLKIYLIYIFFSFVSYILSGR